jgi:hypothetical protein
MNREEIFEAWAPPGALWSPWAKPVTFAQMPEAEPTVAVSVEPPAVPWAPPATNRVGLIIELTGHRSVLAGLALAREGYRPVPLFNACDGPNPARSVSEIKFALREGAQQLRDLELSSEAPPAFLLDSDRKRNDRPLVPGVFDNRWIVLPQDFPSANFLLGHGISQMWLVQVGTAAPANDLAHVLLRWQRVGVQLCTVNTVDPTPLPAAPLTVRRPWFFRSVLFRMLILTGLRQNSAGGFGGVIPQPSSGTG